VQRKTIIISFLVACVTLTGLIATVLIKRGGSLVGVLLTAVVFLLFLIIPLLGTFRSLTTDDVKQRGLHLLPTRRAKAKLLTLFVISPLLVGTIVLIAYPYSPLLTATLSVGVMLAASLFYFLTD